MEGGFVYILQSQNSGRYYIGSALDIQYRLNQHNAGRVVATRNKGPWTLVFSQYYDNIQTARQIEYKIKQKKRRSFIEKNNFRK